MKKILLSAVKIIFGCSILLSLSACNDNDADINAESFDIVLKNTAGGYTLLDRTWYRKCIRDAYLPNTWSYSQRTLSTNELAVTEIFYGSADCASNALMIDVSVVELTNQNESVPIHWTKMDGLTPADAPNGLENVTEANALTFTVTKASRTPLTQTQADLLNSDPNIGFGLTDWAVVTTKDIQPIYALFNNPGTATLILRDNGATGCVYDGIPNPFVEEEYPSNVGNVPHCGALHTLL